MTKITLIAGGNSVGSRLTGITDYLQETIASLGFDVQTIQVHQLPAQALITADFSHPEIVAANQLVSESTAVIIVSPIYKASYSGILKTYLDLLPQKVLKEKITYSVGLGGSQNHLLALQFSLEPILKELGADILLKSSYIVSHQIEKTASLDYQLSIEAKERLNLSIDKIQQLIGKKVLV